MERKVGSAVIFTDIIRTGALTEEASIAIKVASKEIHKREY